MTSFPESYWPKQVDAELLASIEPWLKGELSGGELLHVLTRKFPGLLALPDAGLEVHHLSAGLLVVSFVVVREHANLGGALHGAMFAWLVDELTTIALMSSSSRPRPGVSVHLSVEYAGSAPLGTRVYVEAKAEKCVPTLAQLSEQLPERPERVAPSPGIARIAPTKRSVRGGRQLTDTPTPRSSEDEEGDEDEEGLGVVGAASEELEGDEERSSGHELSSLSSDDDALSSAHAHYDALKTDAAVLNTSAVLSPRQLEAVASSSPRLNAGKTRHGSLAIGARAPPPPLPTSMSTEPTSSPRAQASAGSAAQSGAAASTTFLSPRIEMGSGSVVPEAQWTVDGERRILQWATLKQLIHAFCCADAEHAPDTLALRHLALAHAHFVSSHSLLDQLVKAYRRFAAPVAPGALANASSGGDGSVGNGAPTSAQVRVVKVVKTWIEVAHEVLVEDAACAALLGAFVRELPPQLAQLLESALQTASSKRNAPCHHLLAGEPADTHAGPPETLPARAGEAAVRLVDFEPLEVARQLALIDHEYLAAIPLTELHKKRWTLAEHAPHIEAAAQFQNKLAYWLAHQILREEKTKAQLKAFVHVVAVGKHVLALQDFQALFAVYLAVNLKPVKTLRALWGKLLPKKTQSTLKRIEALNSPLDNFAGYRALVRTLRPPLVPCLEVALKDLLYQCDGSPDFHESHVGVLNMLKLDSLGKGIAHITQCQLPKYCLRRHAPVHALLQQVLAMDKKALLEKSRLTVSAATSTASSPFSSAASSASTSMSTPPPTRLHDADTPAPPDAPALLTSHTRTHPGNKSTDSDTANKDRREEDAAGEDDEEERPHSDDEGTLSKRIGDSLRDLFASPRFRTVRAKDKAKDKSSSPKTSPVKVRDRQRRASDARPHSDIASALATAAAPPAPSSTSTSAARAMPAPLVSAVSAPAEVSALAHRPSKPLPTPPLSPGRPTSPREPSAVAAATPTPSQAATSPRTPAPAEPLGSATTVPERWVVVRKFEKRGGVKVRVPATLEELLQIGAAELGLSHAVCVREVATEAKLKSLDAIEAGAILWVMTPEDESNFD